MNLFYRCVRYVILLSVIVNEFTDKIIPFVALLAKNPYSNIVRELEIDLVALHSKEIPHDGTLLI